MLEGCDWVATCEFAESEDCEDFVVDERVSYSVARDPA